MTRENFSNGTFYNITKNQDNLIKTVGRDSFLSPKIPKNASVLGVIKPPGVAQPLYYRGHNQTQTYNICPSLIKIGSETAEKNSAQTNKQTNRHYENNGHLAVNQLIKISLLFKALSPMSVNQHFRKYFQCDVALAPARKYAMSISLKGLQKISER